MNLKRLFRFCSSSALIALGGWILMLQMSAEQADTEFMSKALPATGIVTNTETTESETRKVFYHPNVPPHEVTTDTCHFILKYETREGQLLESTDYYYGRSCDGLQLHKNRQVPVLYNPDNPIDVRINTDSIPAVESFSYFVFIGAIILICGIKLLEEELSSN